MGSAHWEIDRAGDSGAIRQPVMFRAGLLRSGVRQESTSASALILNLSRRTAVTPPGVFGAESTPISGHRVPCLT